jgi:2,4-dienoyl-CoA reductase-like NADH-dependent reductase (Old Yellow Enzyme family)
MSLHEPFRFPSVTDLKRKISELKLDLELSDNLEILGTPLRIGEQTAPNRLAIHPMEGCDGLVDGSPSPLTVRRYRRFGESGTGLIWYEATAIQTDKTNPMNNPRANPRQLMLTDENKNRFKDILSVVEAGEQRLIGKHPAFGRSVKILQITHSGRYTRPGYNNPLRMYPYQPLDSFFHQTDQEGKILSDEELDLLPEYFEDSIRIAKEIGFNGVDIKSCHRYLLSESLSAFTRSESKYGGPTFENRTRLIRNIFRRVIPKYADPHFLITLRFNMSDGIPFPYGWGVPTVPYTNADKFGALDCPPPADLSEPIRFLKELYDLGVRLVNLTLANPYFNSFVSRPYDQPLPGAGKPQEHPLMGVYRFIQLTREIRSALPSDMRVIGTGYSWLRQYAPQIGAAEVKKQHVDMIGFGRMSFANPQFGQQIFLQKQIDPQQTCITCSKCTELMRKKTVTGCVIRDNKVYLPYYKDEKTPADLSVDSTL